MYTSATVKSDFVPATVETVVFSTTHYGGNVVKIINVPSNRKYYEEIYPAQPERDNRRNLWNDFEHYKLSQNDFGIPARVQAQLSGVWGGSTGNESYLASPVNAHAMYDPSTYGEAGKYDNGLFQMYSKRADGGFVPPPADLDILLDQAHASIMPYIKPELSLVNSVIELKDFASLPRTIASISQLESVLRTAPSSLLRYPSATLRSFGKGLKEWFRTAADSYLQARFNILPLLSDIAGLRRAVSRTERRLNDLITRAGKHQRRHFSRTLTEAPPNTFDELTAPFVSTTTDGDVYGFDQKLQRFSSLSPTTFHVEIEFNYNYTQYQLEHARILSLLDASGVNFNPAIIWNAVPWSFVVDWVLGVSQWLNKQRIGLMDPQINIHRCLWSVKRYQTITVQRQSVVPLYGYGGYPYITSPTAYMPSVTQSAFRRSKYHPSIASLTASGLSITELSLGAALVIARKFRSKPRVSWAAQYALP